MLPMLLARCIRTDPAPDPFAHSHGMGSALHCAVVHGSLEAVQAIAKMTGPAFRRRVDECGQDGVPHSKSSGLTLLHRCHPNTGASAEAMIRKLVELGADPHRRAADGATLLHVCLAMRAPSMEMHGLLLSAGVDPEIRDGRGLTALDAAAIQQGPWTQERRRIANERAELDRAARAPARSSATRI